MNIEKLVLERLIAIRNGERLDMTGICGNVLKGLDNVQHDQADELLDTLILRWPERGESFIYPIGGQLEYLKEKLDETLWQNPRRLALLDWMIKELEHVQAHATVRQPDIESA